MVSDFAGDDCFLFSIFLYFSILGERGDANNRKNERKRCFRLIVALFTLLMTFSLV